MIDRLLIALLRGYKRGLSPLLGPRCRFVPTCSEYAMQAIALHGAARGSWLAARRVARCHPLHPGGHDPVPGAGSGPAHAPLHDPVRDHSANASAPPTDPGSRRP